MEKPEVIVKVTFTEGYEERFTRACLRQLKKREELKRLNERAESMQTAG
jgi:hypothetical protein